MYFYIDISLVALIKIPSCVKIRSLVNYKNLLEDTNVFYVDAPTFSTRSTIARTSSVSSFILPYVTSCD